MRTATGLALLATPTHSFLNTSLSHDDMKLTYYRAKGSGEDLPQLPPGTVRFLCPQCNEFEIIRIPQARKMAAKYTCPKCGFTGPN
jgi:predicted RNA-binding Zn-ribbon protein involved in translation (DUF1610 family)